MVNIVFNGFVGSKDFLTLGFYLPSQVNYLGTERLSILLKPIKEITNLNHIETPSNIEKVNSLTSETFSVLSTSIRELDILLHVWVLFPRQRKYCKTLSVSAPEP